MIYRLINKEEYEEFILINDVIFDHGITLHKQIAGHFKVSGMLPPKLLTFHVIKTKNSITMKSFVAKLEIIEE